MQKFRWPALAGLFLLTGVALAATDSEFLRFSHDESLAYSQAAIGTTLQGIELIKADGSPVSFDDYRGNPLVISMIFSSCHHVCPSTTQYLQQVVNKARSVLGDDSFTVLTIGFDTVNDNPERMAQFRTSTGVTSGNWDFLAADADNIAALVRQLGFIYTPSSRGFDHLVQASIVDADGVIYRQVYGMSFPTPHLIEPMKQLVFGEVGLAGEIRPVPSGQERIAEAAKHGFTRAVVPRGNAPRKALPGMQLFPVSTLAEALALDW